MFEICSKKINFNEKNFIIKKNIFLDKNLDCFILISSSNENFWNILVNNILDFIIDKIGIQDTYKDFSIALENINSTIKKWKLNTKKEIKLNVLIWILNKNNLVFSNIWDSSCYLLNTNNKEIGELTTKNDSFNWYLFDFISNWDLKDNDLIIFSTNRLLDYLSKSDIFDWLDNNFDITNFNKNIENILLSEILNENLIVTSLIYNPKPISSNSDTIINNKPKKLINNKIINFFISSTKKLGKQWKHVKNFIFLSWIIISMFILYSILSSVVWITKTNENKEISKNNVIQAKNFLRIASENIANTDVFELNIKKTEEIISEIDKEKIFINDIEKINKNINILKKQFNKIETIISNNDNLIYEDNFENAIKIIKNNLKPYVINKKYIIWPILPNTIPKKYTFSELEENDYFVDATIVWNSIYISTALSKIVKFSQNNNFNYVDVKWQTTWEKSKEIDSYWENIYLLWKTDNQILKHSNNWKSFNKADEYLKKEDLEQIGRILSIAIDWWFYILKNDLSIIKFFNNPKYRLEKIVLNKLPGNYDTLIENTKIDLKTRNNLNYVYLLLNNKIWVFKPNTKVFTDTKSLTYIWQIEWEKNDIIDFYVNYDWEIMVLNNKWLYKINFEVSDNTLKIR